MTGLGSTYVSVESVQKMNANVKCYLSRSLEWRQDCSVWERSYSCVFVLVYGAQPTVADPSHAFLADLSPLVAQTKYRRRERTKTQTKPNRFITILSLRFKSRHGNILCHTTPVMYLWWAVSRHNECESSEQTFRHDRRTTALPYTCWRQQRTSHFHFPYPFLLPHRGNGFSDLYLPITVRFTQHQPSDSITHQHTSHIMNTPAPLPIAWFPPHQLVTAGVCRMIEMTGALFEIAMMTLMMT